MNAVGREDATAAPRAFAPGQMTACEACGRQSPPTRMSCLYCGARLPAPAGGEDLRRPALRPLEDWERGLNVVLAGAGVAGDDAAGADGETSAGARAIGLGDDAVAEAASLLQIEAEDVRGFASAGVPLPLARTAEAEEAALLEQKLGALGLWVETVADDELAADSRPPKRVRHLAFDDEGLTGRAAGGEEERALWSEIELIVAGRVFERRIETEAAKKRGRDDDSAGSRELTSDESVVDLYFAERAVNWRVGSEGFDFSCLGASKGLLAAENFVRLTSLLRERAPRACFDDSYARLRPLLKFAWPPAEREVSAGLRRARPGVLLAGAATVTSNERQFTRYGRLLRRYATRKDVGRES